MQVTLKAIGVLKRWMRRYAVKDPNFFGALVLLALYKIVLVLYLKRLKFFSHVNSAKVQYMIT